MASLLRNALKAVRKKGIGGVLRVLKEEGYTDCLLDGNLLQTKIHKVGATLVGVDKFGNKYYEKLQNTQFEEVPRKTQVGRGWREGPLQSQVPPGDEVFSSEG